VVREALRAAERGRRVVIPGKRYRLLVALGRVLPARLAAKGALRGR
jgi:hypothetical protein